MVSKRYGAFALSLIAIVAVLFMLWGAGAPAKAATPTSTTSTAGSLPAGCHVDEGTSYARVVCHRIEHGTLRCSSFEHYLAELCGINKGRAGGGTTVEHWRWIGLAPVESDPRFHDCWELPATNVSAPVYNLYRCAGIDFGLPKS